MIKYKTSGGWRWSLDARIDEVEVERETEHSVWINGRVNRKISDFCVYHDTWETAHNYILKHAQRRLDNKRNEYQRAKNVLLSIETMSKENHV